MNYGLASRLNAGRFDALWVHGYMRWQHWTAMATARRLGMKVLVRDEATATSSLRGTLKGKLKRAFFLWLQQIADEFMAIGSLNAEYYRELGVPETYIFMMLYTVDNAFFQVRTLECADQRGHLRAELGLEPERPVICMLAR